MRVTCIYQNSTFYPINVFINDRKQFFCDMQRNETGIDIISSFPWHLNAACPTLLHWKRWIFVHHICSELPRIPSRLCYQSLANWFGQWLLRSWEHQSLCPEWWPRFVFHHPQENNDTRMHCETNKSKREKCLNFFSFNICWKLSWLYLAQLYTCPFYSQDPLL